ncbi:hypothetical protein DPMN_052067 [Dreissena polymorpha]|uniref:Homogentisate 1,2-dioxygenase C-terminal domain-containing protein n=1 Tax=Dreissena polymorpha TaxID=45954 RepID=A0A9D4CJ10_DREPO|nr:hypothetical protein DPMN_052067 [Dreissena polymorpha]
MFESSLSFRVTEWANKTKVDEAYYTCWQPLAKHFSLTEQSPLAKTETGELPRGPLRLLAIRNECS